MKSDLRAVVSPSYYRRGGFEVSDVIEAWELGWNLGNVLKYVARAGHKTPDALIDLRKAQRYLERHIGKLERKR